MPDTNSSGSGGTSQIQHTEYLQRRGRTFTEIAEALGMNRAEVVDALYTRKVRDIVAPEPEFVVERASYAGAMR